MKVFSQGGPAGRSGAVLFEPGRRSGADAPRTPETEKDTRPGGPLRVSAAPLPGQREKELRTHRLTVPPLPMRVYGPQRLLVLFHKPEKDMKSLS